MTAIVALNDAEGFTFGADSAMTDDAGDQDITDDGKLFDNGPMTFGICGSGRMGQLLQFSLVIPKKKRKSQAGLEYMATTFVDAVRECLKNGGFAGKTSGAIADHKEGEEIGGTFVVGFEKQLYIVEENYQVMMPRKPFTAIGSGGTYAIGALYVLRKQNPMLSSRTTALLALEAAERYNAPVRRPFVIRARPH